MFERTLESRTPHPATEAISRTFASPPPPADSAVRRWIKELAVELDPLAYQQLPAMAFGENFDSDQNETSAEPAQPFFLL